VTQSNLEIAPKRLELLHELLPEARVMTLLVDPSNPAVAETTTNQVRVGARTLGLELHVLNASRAPRQFPSLTPPDRANPAAGVNSGLD